MSESEWAQLLELGVMGPVEAERWRASFESSTSRMQALIARMLMGWVKATMRAGARS